jgi:hypothetical protein
MSHPVAQRAGLLPIGCGEEDRFPLRTQDKQKLPEGSAVMGWYIACRLIEQKQRWIC